MEKVIDVKTPDENGEKTVRAVEKIKETKKPAAKKPASKKAAGESSGAKKPKKAGKPEAKAGSEKMEAGKKSVRAKPLRVLIAASEVAPFIATGGMGQVAGALAAALKGYDADMDVRVVIPLYEEVMIHFASELSFVGAGDVSLNWRSLYCGVFETSVDGVTYYFVDNKYYFERSACYGHYDDGERFAYFSKAVFKVMELTGFVPDVIHANDWQTALTVIYLKTRFAAQYRDVKSVFTIHNMEYQGKYPLDILGDVFDLLPEEGGIVEYDGCINLIKGALICADCLTTVSPSYVGEIQSDCGHGLEPIVIENSRKLHGILNGIDTRLYDPETDTTLAKNYTIEAIEGKAANKLMLQELFGLPKAPRRFLVCVVSRLVSHKGIDLLTYIMEDMLKLDLQFLILGTGDHEYELFFSEMQMRHPDRIGVSIAFNPALATKIYAGADAMLMPSHSEPCGIAQMIACRYGTIPIVRATGGLKDSIRDCRGGDGNGFVFTEYNASVLLETICQALDLYKYREDDWHNLIKEAMNTDFSWVSSAARYAELYDSLRSE